VTIAGSGVVNFGLASVFVFRWPRSSSELTSVRRDWASAQPLGRPKGRPLRTDNASTQVNSGAGSDSAPVASSAVPLTPWRAAIRGEWSVSPTGSRQTR
jgi:hypothetical protein